MDDANLPTDCWSWLDEGDQLDVGSPLVTSAFIWDDLGENDAVVRSLFPPSPLLLDHVKDSEPLQLCFNHEQKDSPDSSPVPPKRRRILDSNEENILDISACLPQLSKTSDEFFDLYEDLHQVNPLSSVSTCHTTNEASLSSVDETVEQTSGSSQSVVMGKRGARDGQERIHRPGKPPIDVRMTKAAMDINAGFITGKIQSTLSGSVRQRRMPTKVVHSTEPALKQSLENSSSLTKCPISVLAYPFALVKPMGIQGDITLQDINKRINSSLGRIEACFEQPNRMAAMSYSRKSVLAFTKIHTEGNGTITIMRTKG